MFRDRHCSIDRFSVSLSACHQSSGQQDFGLGDGLVESASYVKGGYSNGAVKIRNED